MKNYQKNSKNKKIWIPRILSIIYTSFFFLMSFDTIGIGLLIHNIPSIILLTLTIYSWKNRKYSGHLWIILSIIATIFFKTYNDIISILTLTLIPLTIGILLLKKKSKELTPTHFTD